MLRLYGRRKNAWQYAYHSTTRTERDNLGRDGDLDLDARLQADARLHEKKNIINHSIQSNIKGGGLTICLTISLEE